MPVATRKRRNHSSEILGSHRQQNPVIEFEILRHYEVSETLGEAATESDKLFLVYINIS
jgi:hypothetical protein